MIYFLFLLCLAQESRIIGSGATLELMKVKKDDEGFYECKASNELGTISNLFKIEILGKIIKLIVKLTDNLLPKD